MCRMPLFLVPACLVMVSGGPTNATAGPAEHPTMAAVREAYKKRQDQLKTARFVWAIKRTDTRGSYSKFLKIVDQRSKFLQSGKPLPPVDTNLEETGKLTISGESILYERNGTDWWGDFDRYVRFQSLSSFHNGEGRMVMIPEPPRPTFHQCQIREGSRFDEAGDPKVCMFTFHYRAYSPTLRPWLLDHFVPTGRKAKIEGVECVELIREPKGGNRQDYTALWLAPSRDYVMIRKLTIEDGLLLSQHTVQHTHDSIIGWTPASWHWVLNDGKGQLNRSQQITVEKRSINEAIDPSSCAI